MRNFSKTIKDIIDCINQTKISAAQMLGVEIAEILFHEKECALVMEEGRAVLVCANDEKSKTKIAILCELFSLLQYMEANHIIYVVEQELESPVIFQHNVNDFKEDGIPEQYDLGNSNKLIINNRKYAIENNNGSVKLNQNTDIAFLYEDCIHFLCSIIMPTALMGEFISHNYMSANDYLTKQSMTIAKFSLFIAVFVACLSPIVSVMVSNKYGYSTLNKSQYESLVNAVSDTAATLRHDTVKLYIPDGDKNKSSVRNSVKK